MTQLMKKDVKFIWSDKCEENFLKLKEKLFTASVLTISNEKDKFVIYSDASGKGLGLDVHLCRMRKLSPMHQDN